MTFNENWYSDEQCNNLSFFARSVLNLEGVYIEIGCWEGKSTHILVNTIYPQNLICNDTWLGNIAESQTTGYTHITEIILSQRDVYSIFIENMNKLTKKNYTIVKEDCLEWLKLFNQKIKFCHIDASHEYESVYRTIELILPNLVSGGILCGGDFLNASKERLDLNGGVERAVRDHLPEVRNIGNLWYWKKL